MTELMLYPDDMTLIQLTGDIRLLASNPQTHDFVLTIGRHNLTAGRYTLPEVSRALQHDDWSWLTALPLTKLVFDNRVLIRPIWRPNRFGQRADTNAFQTVTMTAKTVLLQVSARGTQFDVYRRYQPYQGHQFTSGLTYEQYQAQQRAMQTTVSELGLNNWLAS
ncbi:hypothetical protein [Levilactobacillus spicheri]|uniref:Uncharacterized protein n=2 Tax=Levilactobacillus spicheri TaxID=216463 RepID=A0ABQ0WNV3_9LACO|nr:hypothetical protein [Levilactobacillus spicheri]KRL50136.1 hypothetical protein FD37_GL002267 [Levilactobacillus spicheri DSM 15429]GEO65754.1 hypothetical protein LSP04_01730 [Levilactobacillus spicheri]